MNFPRSDQLALAIFCLSAVLMLVPYILPQTPAAIKSLKRAAGALLLVAVGLLGSYFWPQRPVPNHATKPTQPASAKSSQDQHVSSSALSPVPSNHKRSSPHRSVPKVGQNQRASSPESADHGIINNAPNFGQQTVEDNRRYGVPRPPPQISFKQFPLTPVPPQPPSSDPRTERFNTIARIAEGKIHDPNPGVHLLITVDGVFSDPAFQIRCSSQCYLVRFSLLDLPVEEQAIGFSDPTLVGFRFSNPQQLQPGAEVIVDIRSADANKVHVIDVAPYVPPIE